MNDIVTRENAAVATALPSNATSLLQAIERAASNPQTDIEKMERLFAMHEKMVQREAESAFNAAMARAQAKIVPVATNASNTQTNSRYAKLSAINKAITPIYTAEGLSVSFDAGDPPREGWQRILAVVLHSAGHSRNYHLDLPLDDVGAKGTVNKTKVHATGSTNSYGKRYLVCNIFNVSTEDDDDGNKGGGRDGLSESAFTDFVNAIDGAGDAHALEGIWKRAVQACNEAKDKESYDALKAQVATKGKAFKGVTA